LIDAHSALVSAARVEVGLPRGMEEMALTVRLIIFHYDGPKSNHGRKVYSFSLGVVRDICFCDSKVEN